MRRTAPSPAPRLSAAPRRTAAAPRDGTAAREAPCEANTREPRGPLYQHCGPSLDPASLILAFATAVSHGPNRPPSTDGETDTKGSQRDLAKVTRLVSGRAEPCLGPLEAEVNKPPVKRRAALLPSVRSLAHRPRGPALASPSRPRPRALPEPRLCRPFNGLRLGE